VPRLRPLAAAVATLVLSGACASPQHVPPAASPTAAGAATTAGSPATGALGQAIAASRRLSSYAFATTLAVGSSTTRISGAVVQPDELTYTLTTGGRSEQVVRLLGATYVRTVPGHWKRLPKAQPASDPVQALITVLSGITGPTTSVVVGETVVAGILPPPVAQAAGLLPAGASRTVRVAVSVTIDPAHQVTRLQVVLPVSVRGRVLQAVQTTTFSRFDSVPPITVPSG